MKWLYVLFSKKTHVFVNYIARKKVEKPEFNGVGLSIVIFWWRM